MNRRLDDLGLATCVAALLLMTIAAPVLPTVSASNPNSLSPASTYTSGDWMSWAQTAWNYFQPGVGVNSGTGLHQASLTSSCFTDWDSASYIYATISASKLGLITDGGAWQFSDRVGKVLSFLQNRPLLANNAPYSAYRWDSLPGAWCTTFGSTPYASDGADQGRLLAALYALKTYRSSYAAQVNAIFNRSKSYYNTLYTQLGVEYYSYLMAEGYAAFGYDESNIFNGIENYNGATVSVYGQNLPRVYTVAEPIILALLESDTLVHQPSSSFVDFANRVKLAQQGRYSNTGKLTAWSEGGYAPNSGQTDPYYMYEVILDNDGVSTWVMKLGSTYYNPSTEPPLVYTKVAFSYLALYGENTYTLALVNAIKGLVSPCTFGSSLCGFGEGAYEDGSSAYSRFNGNFFYTDKTNELVLAAASHMLATPPPTCPTPSPETPGTSFFHPYTDFWFSRYDMVNAGWDAIHFVNVGSGTATIQITIGSVLSDSLTLAAGGATYKTYPGIQGGPVHVTSNQPIWVTQRILGWTAMQEIYGMPGNVPSGDIVGTWYDLVNTQSDDVYLINPSTQTATVNVCVAGYLRGTYNVPPKQEVATSFPGIIGGPLRILSNVPVFASQRVIGFSDFAEIVGLPTWYTFTETWFNWYDMQGADWDAIHVLNPGTNVATVSIYVGGTLKDSFTLAAGAADYRTFPGLIGGPVRVVSTQPIWVTQRIIGWGGWKEVFGVPTTLAKTQWYMTWYDMQNAQWDAIHVINQGATGATVQIYVGGVLKSTISVGAGQEAYVTYPGLMTGPVRIVSTVPVISSQRILGWGSFEETIGASIT